MRMFVALVLVFASLNAYAVENKDCGTNKFGMNFRCIPAGQFLMGSPKTELGHYEDEQLHKVTISHAFEMETTLVTQDSWKSVMGFNHISIDDPDFGPQNPIEYVGGDYLREFIGKLNSSHDGYSYRLPTEAEWEYATRAGTQTAYFFGDDIGTDGSVINQYAWSSLNNSNTRLRPVGMLSPNGFGLYDMVGNVWQLVEDHFQGDLGFEDQTDPVVKEGDMLVIRGEMWGGHPDDHILHPYRSAYRTNIQPNVCGYAAVGIRMVRTK